MHFEKFYVESLLNPMIKISYFQFVRRSNGKFYILAVINDNFEYFEKKEKRKEFQLGELNA